MFAPGQLFFMRSVVSSFRPGSGFDSFGARNAVNVTVIEGCRECQLLNAAGRIVAARQKKLRTDRLQRSTEKARSRRAPEMSGLASRFLIEFATIYGLLITVYYVLGLLITLANRRFVADRKIQNVSTPANLIVRDMVQSTLSLAHIAFFIAVGSTMRAMGIGVQPWRSTMGSVIGSLALSLMFFDTWFYWGHRLLHTKFLYHRAHLWHHEVRTPVVWSNNSDTLLDNLVLQSYWMVAPLLFPAPGIVYLIHKLYDQVSGMIGHSGHEYNISLARFPSPLLAVIHHDQHHRYNKYNFATHFVLWDRIMRTLHPRYDDAVINYVKTQNGSSIESRDAILSLNGRR
jgi:Delta7-sterol 5-desaturase